MPGASIPRIHATKHVASMFPTSRIRQATRFRAKQRFLRERAHQPLSYDYAGVRSNKADSTPDASKSATSACVLEYPV